MLPPLKSLILKWGLLAQWLYWAKYLQAILACSAILLPGHGHVFLLSNCPDTDSLCCQHPSYLFTDVDRCIMISVHLISTLTVIDMPFPDEAGHFQCQRIYFFQKWILLFIHGWCIFNSFFVFLYSRILSLSIWLYRKRQQPNVFPRSIFCSSVG